MGHHGRAMDPCEDFDAFFMALLPAVLRLAKGMTGDRTAAEDVAAEAFARAFACWEKVGRLDYREAWVLRVASNLAIDLARRRHPEMPARAAAPDLADDVVLRLTLLDALRSMPRTQREALVLR